MTPTTIAVASSRVKITSSMAPLMKVASSEVMISETSSGNEVWRSATASWTRAEISSVFEDAWRTSAMPTPVTPLTRMVLDSSARPKTTSATSLTRVVGLILTAPIS